MTKTEMGINQPDVQWVEGYTILGEKLVDPVSIEAQADFPEVVGPTVTTSGSALVR